MSLRPSEAVNNNKVGLLLEGIILVVMVLCDRVLAFVDARKRLSAVIFLLPELPLKLPNEAMKLLSLHGKDLMSI